MKVINKKLITMSTKKVNGRNVTAANSTENMTAIDNSKSVSATRPAALNLNFNAITNLANHPMPVHQGIATATNQHYSHSSAMSRFAGNPNTIENVSVSDDSHTLFNLCGKQSNAIEVSLSH